MSEDRFADLRGHLLVDGYDLLLDLEASHGSWIVDRTTGVEHLDLFSFYASNALGMNHPAFDDPDVRARLLRTAIHKPSNSDVYTAPMVAFVDTFERVLGVDHLPWLFLIEGGALAVENACKAAFDWKSRHNEAAGRDPALGTRILHLEHAFHGRSGYTMSMSNTDPRKVARFPKFDWPRIPSPAIRFPEEAHRDEVRAAEDASLAAARAAFEAHPHDIAGVLVEPIQSEGGDRHLSGRYLRALQDLAHEHDALFLVDEVQTGVGYTGRRWAFEHFDLTPDLLAFGKKTHVCGVMGGGRIDEVSDHVWRTSSRINSTFGGNLTDMTRATVMLEVIERDGLIAAAADTGEWLHEHLTALAADHPMVTNVRGRGLLRAVDLPDTATRNDVIARLLRDHRVLALGCGPRTLRLRPTMTATRDDLTVGLEAIAKVLAELA